MVLGWLLGGLAYAQESEEMYFSHQPTFVETFNYGWEEENQAIGAGDWNIAFWMQNGAQMAVDRCTTNVEGHLIQTVLPGEPYRGGSIESVGEFGYGRWVARVKPSPVPGVLNSVFVKDWDDRATTTPYDDGNHFEVDIEFLTYTFGKDTGSVHVAIHRKNEDNVLTKMIGLDFNPSEEFHDWGFDISPNWVKWHVDGEVIHTWYPEEDYTIPATAYEMFFNSWTMKEWINGPATEVAYYHIDQVQFWEEVLVSDVSAPVVDTEINAFPNPTQNRLNIRSSQLFSRLKMIDAYGRTVRVVTIPSTDYYELETTDLSEGIYYLSIGHLGETSPFVRRVVIGR